MQCGHWETVKLDSKGMQEQLGIGGNIMVGSAGKFLCATASLRGSAEFTPSQICSRRHHLLEAFSHVVNNARRLFDSRKMHCKRGNFGMQ